MKLTAKGDSTKLSIVLVHGIWFDDLELYNVIGGLQKAVAEKTHQLSLLNTTLEEQKQAIATLVHLQKIGITTTEIQQLGEPCWWTIVGQGADCKPYTYLTTKTEQWTCCITPFATLPMKNLFNPVLPLVPITIRSIFLRVA